jgi:lipopolysaccharide biosynthesis glycosyltransferase
MNIAYACDDNYIAHTGISVLSLFDKNEMVEEINIYLISVDISAENIRQIQDIVDKYQRKLIVIPFKELCPNLKLSNVGRHIETVYAKLFFGNIENIDKIIYLDSDIIINNSLQEMWEINLGDNYYGLVKTVTKDYSEKLGLTTSDIFFNDGVAIVNTRKLREGNMQQKFLAFIDQYHGNPPVLSEGTINVVCKDKIQAIHPKFNFGSSFLMYDNKSMRIMANEVEYYSDKMLNDARKSPVVIHYLTGWFKRPWEIGCTHPLKAKYLEYKKQTIWANQPLTFKELPLKIKLLKLFSNLFPMVVVKVFIDSFRSFKKWF